VLQLDFIVKEKKKKKDESRLFGENNGGLNTV
jgi:hypothetical protein